MQSEPQERSLNELIEIAKRAQSILGHLDLAAIGSAQPQESAAELIDTVRRHIARPTARER